MVKQVVSNSRLCPLCNAVLKESAKKWVYCPNTNWKDKSKGCQYKGYSNYGKSVAVNSLPIQSLETPSDEQSAIMQWASKSNQNAIIRALAGTGKTTQLIQLVRILAQEQGKNVLCLAFASRDKEALLARTNSKCKVWTNNGAGMSVLSAFVRSQRGKLEINTSVSWQMLEAQWRADGHIKGGKGETEWTLSYGVFSAIRSIVDKVRTCLPLSATGKKAPTDQDLLDIANRFDIEIAQDDMPTIIHYSQWLFSQIVSLKNMMVYGVDLTGQVFLPVYYGLAPSTPYDCVLVDETQDQNYYNRALAFLMVKRGGNLIAVGDEYQAIYGWRGADNDSMGEMSALMAIQGKEEPKEFPLTLNRRSTPAIIETAQLMVPAIRGLSAEEWLDARKIDAALKGHACEYTLETAEQGTRHLATTEMLFQEIAQKRKGLVLCRSNAPLVSLCLKLLAKRIPAALSRSNVVGDLLRLIDTLSECSDSMPIVELLAKLEVWALDRLAKLSKQRNGSGKAQNVHDKVDCIHALSEEQGIQTAKDLKTKIDEIFADDAKIDARNMVVLSTVHGAKGSESPFVYVLSPERDKTCIFDQVWSGAADRDNTLYVAITRAEAELIWVGHMPTLKPFLMSEPDADDEMD